MDTKTRKVEALELLALDELTPDQVDRLDWLTMQQAGIFLEDFHHSIDACISLLKTLSCDWHINIVPGFNDSPEIIVGSQQEFYAIAKAYTVEAIAIELLRGYWTMQPD